MSTKRRRSNSQITISLFAFQDIITCLSGIMILLLLMISVDIAAQKLNINISDLSPSDTNAAQVESEKSLKQNIQNLKKVADNSSDDLVDYQIRHQELTDKIKELEEKRESFLHQKEAVSFIPAKDANPNQRALLVECSGEFIRLGGVAFPADQRGTAGFIQYLETLDKLRDYPVFIIKPSASNYAMQLVQTVQNMGFDTGYDAMAESERVDFSNNNR